MRWGNSPKEKYAWARRGIRKHASCLYTKRTMLVIFLECCAYYDGEYDGLIWSTRTRIIYIKGVSIFKCDTMMDDVVCMNARKTQAKRIFNSSSAHFRAECLAFLTPFGDFGRCAAAVLCVCVLFFFKPIYITIYSWLIVFLRCALNKIARGGRPLGFTKFLYTLSVCVTVFFSSTWLTSFHFGNTHILKRGSAQYQILVFLIEYGGGEQEEAKPCTNGISMLLRVSWFKCKINWRVVFN